MSRPESRAPSTRKRSNTVQSVFNPSPIPPPPPLKIGDARTLTAWVNEPGTTTVKLNHKHWPGVAEGDLICIASPLPEHAPGFLFVVPAEDSSAKHQLQVSRVRIARAMQRLMPREDIATAAGVGEVWVEEQ